MNRLQIDDAQGPHVGRIVYLILFHQFASPLNNPAHPRFAHEHVVRLLGQHETASTRKWIKSRFRERAKLEFAVPIRKERKHVKRQPVRRRLIERAEDARIVRIAGTPRQQCFSLFSAIAAKVTVQQVHHGPQMASFFDVHLKNVPQIVQRRTGKPQHLLLFHGSRLCISLRHDDSPERRAVFTRHLLPCRLALVCAEIHVPLFIARLQENPPPVLRHLHIVKLRPAIRLHANRSPQVHIIIAALVRAGVVPPAEERGLPMLQGALQDTVSPQVHVVWNSFRIVDHRRSPQYPSG